MTPLQRVEMKNTEFPVLGNGYVKYIAHLGTDETIVEAARMSTQRGFVGWGWYRRCEQCDLIHHEGAEEIFPACVPPDPEHKWKVFPRGDNGILESLYRDRHMTPFEMCELVVEVKAPIFIFRELHRHRTFSINEMSARYTQMPNEHFVPPLERFKPKHTGNKQADSVRPLSESKASQFRVTPEDMQVGLCAEQEEIYSEYEFLLEQGVPKEIARVNTPVSRMSVMRWKANLRNFMQMFALRVHPAAQLECQQVVQPAYDIAKVLWPRTMELYEEYTRYAVTLSRTELKLLKAMLAPNASDWVGDAGKLFDKLKGTAG